MKDAYSIFLERYKGFTEIQSLAIGQVKEGFDCIITAPTGSGKTEAAMLPIINMLIGIDDKAGVNAIYVTPLRSLNRDLMKRLEWICKEVGVSLAVRHGDTSQSERMAQAAKPPQLLITTPESLQGFFLSERVRNSLSRLKVLIVDEVHELYHNKRGAQLAVAMERLEAIAPGYQRVCISATVGNVEEISKFMFNGKKYKHIKSEGMKKFEVKVEMPERAGAGHREFMRTAGIDEAAMARIERIEEIVSESKQTILFTNTRKLAEMLGSRLMQLDKTDRLGGIAIHHSSLEKRERLEVEDGFKKGEIRCVVATSSLELGIDVGEIDRVVQYGSPRQATRFVQRIGRGGHSERGIARGEILVSGIIDAVESSAVIESAVKGRFEGYQIERGALDVLVNQMCAIAIEYSGINDEKMFRLIKSSAPYSGISKGEFDVVLEFARGLRLLTIADHIVKPGGRCLEYFYSNISVIPDAHKFSVKDIVRNKIVSVLDDKFVYSSLDEGSVFVTRGVPWRVVSIDDDLVRVERSSEIEAAIPDWEGEDIPVPYEIANSTVNMIEMGGEFPFMERGCREKVLSFIASQSKHFVPSAGKVVIEDLDDYAIIYVTLGKLGNEFLARILHRLMGLRNITFRATPYSIIVDYSASAKKPDIEKAIGSLRKMKLGVEFVEETELFRYKFAQIAKLFGVADKKAVLTKSMIDRLIRFYKDSPIYREAIRDIQKNYIDIETVAKFAEALKSDRILVEYRYSDSPLTREMQAYVTKYIEFSKMGPPKEEEITQFQEKFKERSVMLLCTYCSYEFYETVSIKADKNIRCKRCGSTMVVRDLERYRLIMKDKLKGKRKKGKESEEMFREAGLISVYGSRALVALLAYGIGISTAARILRLLRREPRDFVAEIIQAQKTFVKNSRFWKR